MEKVQLDSKNGLQVPGSLSDACVSVKFFPEKKIEACLLDIMDKSKD